MRQVIIYDDGRPYTAMKFWAGFAGSITVSSASFGGSLYLSGFEDFSIWSLFLSALGVGTLVNFAFEVMREAIFPRRWRQNIEEVETRLAIEKYMRDATQNGGLK